MIDRNTFDERAAALFKAQYSMAGPVKDGKRIVRPRTPLPFTRHEFAAWLMRDIGLQAKLCPYGCGRPIDILSCQVDHVIPRGQQGSFDLDNLATCCEHCNQLKGNMSGSSFLLLMECGRNMYPKDWELLQKRILIGGQAQQLRWRNIRMQRQQKQAGIAVSPPTGELDFDPF